MFDPDVRRVADFIRDNVAPERRTGVAMAVAKVASALWGESKVPVTALVEAEERKE